MILSLHKWLPMIMAAQVPQGQKETVPNSPGASAAGTDGVPPQASAGVQTSPTLSEINDTTYYQIDPNRPSERVLGTQLKEALHRARQVDTMQSTLHKTQAERDDLQQRLQKSSAELNQIMEHQRLNQRLAELGYQPNPAPASPQSPTGLPQTGYQDPGTDEYLFGDPPQPTPQPQVNVTSPDFLRNLQGMIDQTVKQALGPVNELIQGTTAEGLTAYNQERETRDTIMRSMQQHEEAQALELRSKGAAETEIQRVLDMERTAVIRAREAEGLLAVTGIDRDNAIALGNIKLNEADSLRAKAIQARLAIELESERLKPAIAAAAMLENNAYADRITKDMPTDPNQARSFKPEEAVAKHKATLEAAKSLAKERRLHTEASGGRII